MTKHWVKRPGKLTAQAKKAGAVTEGGAIDADWLKKQSHSGNRAAQIALALRTMH